MSDIRAIIIYHAWQPKTQWGCLFPPSKHHRHPSQLADAQQPKSNSYLLIQWLVAIQMKSDTEMETSLASHVHRKQKHAHRLIKPIKCKKTYPIKQQLIEFVLYLRGQMRSLH